MLLTFQFLEYGNVIFGFERKYILPIKHCNTNTGLGFFESFSPAPHQTRL